MKSIHLIAIVMIWRNRWIFWVWAYQNYILWIHRFLIIKQNLRKFFNYSSILLNYLFLKLRLRLRLRLVILWNWKFLHWNDGYNSDGSKRYLIWKKKY